MNLKTLFTMACVALMAAAALQTAVAQDVKPQKSPYAETVQRIGTTDVKITYHRPGVKGREIWGKLVPFGGEKPWRAGANDATTFSVNKDVVIEGKALPAGTYSFYAFTGENEWTLVFNKVDKTWGSYEYDASKDALRVKVKPEKAENQEWLAYGFDNLSESSAMGYLHWEKCKVSFKIEAK